MLGQAAFEILSLTNVETAAWIAKDIDMELHIFAGCSKVGSPGRDSKPEPIGLILPRKESLSR